MSSGVPRVMGVLIRGRSRLPCWANRGMDHVAACEAMAAGRAVVGHTPKSRCYAVKRETGLNLPIIEATPDIVGDVARAFAVDPAARTMAGTVGVAFVRLVHDGAHSARVLLNRWIHG